MWTEAQFILQCFSRGQYALSNKKLLVRAHGSNFLSFDFSENDDFSVSLQSHRLLILRNLTISALFRDNKVAETVLL